MAVITEDSYYRYFDYIWRKITVMRRFLVMISVLILSSCIKDRPYDGDLEVGNYLPDFEVVMNDGTVVNDDILGKGISVVMFFHTSCPDCQQTLPRMQQIYDEYTSKGVLFALISREEGKEDIESYFAEKGLKMPYSAQKDRKVYEKFAQTRIPRVYICGKGGIIRYIFTDDPVPSYSELKTSVEAVIR